MIIQIGDWEERTYMEINPAQQAPITINSCWRDDVVWNFMNYLKEVRAGDLDVGGVLYEALVNEDYH